MDSQILKQCRFSNDNNILVDAPANHPFTRNLSVRDLHEVHFRQIVTWLLNNGYINGGIIDLGAWIGDNTIPWAINNSDFNVYAIDPSIKNCEYIDQVCKINKIENVVIIKTAISDKESTLYTNDELTHCSFVPNGNVIGKNKAYATTLDILHNTKVLKKIAFIHLDVEGFEEKVIKGARQLIDEYRPIIAFEQHLMIDDYIGLSKYLKGYNYEIYMIDEVLPGCRPDCRNLLSIPSELNVTQIVREINESLDYFVLVKVDTQ